VSSRTTVVFGGSSGIGLAIAARCARDGDALVLVARDPGKLAHAAEEVRQAGASGVQVLATDFGDSQRLGEALETLAALAPAPDRLVLNGPGPKFGRFTELTIDDWSDGVRSVLLAHVQILQALLPRLRRGSAVVAVLSDVVRNAGAEKVLPCALRLALLGVVKCVALQYAGTGIRVNAVSPGPTATARATSLLGRAAAAAGRTVDEERDRLARTLPMGRLAEPEEIAAVAHFLLSDDAGYVSGMNYVCDGCLTTVPL
jgi:3-oxoacyl-[acyl-carrier protein] reductase